jgi:hypothetical protein
MFTFGFHVQTQSTPFNAGCQKVLIYSVSRFYDDIAFRDAFSTVTPTNS